jgi:hypothetical protein
MDRQPLKVDHQPLQVDHQSLQVDHQRLQIAQIGRGARPARPCCANGPFFSEPRSDASGERVPATTQRQHRQTRQRQ